MKLVINHRGWIVQFDKYVSFLQYLFTAEPITTGSWASKIVPIPRMLLYSCLLNTRVPHLVSFSYCATCAWPVLTVDSNCNTISQCCVPTWPPSGRRTIRGASILTASFDLAGSKPDLSLGYEVCVAISQIRLAIPLRTPSTICHRHL